MIDFPESDDFYVQIADQNGKPIKLPQEERKVRSCIIGCAHNTCIQVNIVPGNEYQQQTAFCTLLTSFNPRQ
jgi:hypothetical protein